MPQVDKPTDTPVVGQNQIQQNMQGAQTEGPKKTDQQKPQVVQNGHTQQRNQQVIQNGHTQQGAKVMQNGHTQQGAKVIQNGHTQQGSKVIQQGKTHQGDQSNLTGKNQENQYNTLCKKMKQKRQNFRIATQELNAAAKQLLTKRKHNKQQYFKHTDAKCRDAIPSMMNAEASTRQGVGSVAAYGKAGVGALSRGVTSLFKKKEAA